MIQFSSTFAELDQFLSGATTTLCVALLGALFGLGVGFGLLLLRTGRWAPLQSLARLYLSFVRGTPLLVQIFLIYYALPGLVGIDLPPFGAGVIALSLNSGAFASEILRGGLSAIPRTQFDAAQALGLSSFDEWFRVILPQLARLVLLPMLNELVLLVQGSALLSVISVVDLTRAAQNVMNATYRPFEALTCAAFIYFIGLFALSHGTRGLRRKVPVARS